MFAGLDALRLIDEQNRLTKARYAAHEAIARRNLEMAMMQARQEQRDRVEDAQWREVEKPPALLGHG